MEIVYSHEGLSTYLDRELGADPDGAAHPESPEGSPSIFLDRFLEDSLEVDVDALCDGTDAWIGGIMQHVEEAGVHSGDSACVLPPHSLGEEMLEQIRSATRDIATAIGVVGLINVQYAIHAGELYVIEANPRASRTVPFVSKAVGLPLAKLACRVMLGEKLAEMELPQERQGLGFGDHISVKEAVLPFDRFENSDAVLGPEMRSTGEVMGIARDFPTRLREGPGRGRGAAAELRHDLHHRHRRRQGGRRGHRADTPRLRLQDRRHARNRRGDLAHGRARRAAQQDR